MTLRQLIHLFWLSLIAIGILVIQRWNPKHRNRWIGVCIIFVLLLWQLSGFVPLLYPFSTPEEAFHYTCGEEISLKIEGSHTCLLIGENSAKQTTIIKTDSGWKNTFSLATQTLFQWQKNGIIVYALQHKASGDCYLAVVAPYLVNCEISDSNQSTFYKCPDMAPEGKQVVNYYYAYIGSVDENYEVHVNDLTFTVS